MLRLKHSNYLLHLLLLYAFLSIAVELQNNSVCLRVPSVLMLNDDSSSSAILPSFFSTLGVCVCKCAKATKLRDKNKLLFFILIKIQLTALCTLFLFY